MVESQLDKDLKNPATATVAKQKLNSRIVASNLEFEIVSMNEYGAGANANINFMIDVTNPTNLDCKAGYIYYTLEATTEDGKRYTSMTTLIHTDLLAGQTSNSLVVFSTRGKKVVGIRIYTQVP
jgi:hypothetical protein